MPPQDDVASAYMRQRGYTLQPAASERVEGQHVWYYLYALPEGDLEIEVAWTHDKGWQVVPTGFIKED